jgi:hypothetical protein
MTKSPNWLRVRISKARLNDWVKALAGVRILCTQFEARARILSLAASWCIGKPQHGHAYKGHDLETFNIDRKKVTQ